MRKGSVEKPVAPTRCQCGQMADRMVPENVSVAFSARVKGMGPQDTGVASIDHDVDRVIGEDARQKWNGIRQRVKDKIQVIQSNPGSTGFDLSRQTDGTYRVMDPEERKAAELGRKVHADAMRIIKADQDQ